MRHLAMLGAAFLLATDGHARVRALQPIVYHDNEQPAGELRDGTLSVAFAVVEGDWRLNGAERPGAPMLAFAGPDGHPTLPGPLLRVPVGTRLSVTVTNRSDSVLVLRGISDDPADSTLLQPGETATAHGRAARAGNRFYELGYRGQSVRERRGMDGHLAGALIVDAPGARTATEHVMLVTSSFHSRDSLGRYTRAREIFTINGRPWPNTKRYRGTVGDTLRFRVLNASEDGHPMHLHGSFFRVEARGDALADTVRTPDEQRMVVTEFMAPATTMTMAWAPDRPGGWLMHCHLTFHTTPNVGFGADSLSGDAAFAANTQLHHGADPDNHIVEGMGGLMTSIEVAVPPDWSLQPVARRAVRFEIPDDSVPGEFAPRYPPVIRDGEHVEQPLGPHGPGGVLLLRQGEPTAITVVNGSLSPTAIHWHGMELESYFDGVVGVGGTPSHRTRAVAARDSFVAYMTPPRAGTFIYHTHFLEVKQATFGLYGAMIVLPPDGAWDSDHDHYFITGPDIDAPRLNGDTLLAPLSWALGSEHRLRLINITAGNPNLRFELQRADGSTVTWTSAAKDGWELPLAKRAMQPAVQHVSMGETYDKLVRLDQPGDYRLILRNNAPRPRIFAVQSIRVTPGR